MDEQANESRQKQSLNVTLYAIALILECALSVCVLHYTQTRFIIKLNGGGGGGDYFVKCIPSDSILFSIMSMTVSEPAHVYVCLCCGTATALVFNAKRESFRGSTSQKFM